MSEKRNCMEIRIIGGSHAAIACATRAREEYPNARIVIYEKNKKVFKKFFKHS
jgi:NADPH-dependent 2,4-dienoyl-CoA reductase/sulfur reductase-like enzyme